MKDAKKEGRTVRIREGKRGEKRGGKKKKGEKNSRSEVVQNYSLEKLAQ